jgi:hypothetical protein
LWSGRAGVGPIVPRAPGLIWVHGFMAGDVMVDWSLPMLGRATLTIDASRTTTNCAAQSKINALHRRARYSCDKGPSYLRG